MTKKLLFCLLTVLSVAAQAKTGIRWNSQKDKYRDHNFYTTSGVEGALFQFGDLSGAKYTNKNGKTMEQKMIPRFTYFFNMGADYNYKLGKNFSVFTGLNVRNIGLIAKYDSLKLKHRVYTVGFPLGFRIHSADRKTWFKAGLDCSWAIHYKMKTFIDNKKTDKYSAWFSDRAATFFPSVFAGLNVSGVTLNTNVYLDNFFNPYNPHNLNYQGDLITVGLGFNFEKTFKTKKIKKAAQAEETK